MIDFCSYCGKNLKENIQKEKNSVKEKKTNSNILAGIMLLLFFPLGELGIAIIGEEGIILSEVDIVVAKVQLGLDQ